MQFNSWLFPVFPCLLNFPVLKVAKTTIRIKWRGLWERHHYFCLNCGVRAIDHKAEAWQSSVITITRLITNCMVGYWVHNVFHIILYAAALPWACNHFLVVHTWKKGGFVPLFDFFPLFGFYVVMLSVCLSKDLLFLVQLINIMSLGEKINIGKVTDVLVVEV